MARLFFALWPDASARAALAERAVQIAKRLGGRPVPGANLHLTLVFLGDVEEERIGQLEDAAGSVTGGEFTLDLDRVGGFRRARVAWAGCRVAPEGLLALQAGLEKRIRKAGFAPDERPFAPHLTLARHVREAVELSDVETAAWRVRDFALVESARGAGAYRTLARWPLGPEKT